jgi:rod shape-determining protein MreC
VLVITKMSDQVSSQEAKDLAESEAEQKKASDVLAERLPSRIDPNAPPDTNPEQLVNAAGAPVKPAAAPQPIHPDRFSPGAEPDAAQMIPGPRWAPVKNGTEDRPVPVNTGPELAAGASPHIAAPPPTASSSGKTSLSAVAAGHTVTMKPQIEKPRVTEGSQAEKPVQKAPPKAVVVPVRRPSRTAAAPGDRTPTLATPPAEGPNR